MATEGLEPKTFSSWEEAFQHPIPAVRAMEKQLRRDIDSNKERLRTLVGASYRDLLDTAEAIIEMNDQMHNVEAHISEIGQKCNTRLLEKKADNFHTWQEGVNGPDSARYTLAAQLAVLRSCPDVMSRLLENRASVLLVAKTLIISRLLHTKLSKRPNHPPYLETLRNRLATSRRKLLTRIDRRFKMLNTSKEDLVEAMCAFALATSSSTTDVVRHFHEMRREAMAECMARVAGNRDNMLQALQLYVKTLRDTQALVPVQLAHALERVKGVSIFKSQDLHDLIELHLDVHEKWIGDDIKTFTPYIRHDDLRRPEAEKMLKEWARLAISKFLDGLRNKIQEVKDPAQLSKLREEMLELWLSQQMHSLGTDSAETLDGLRDVFNDQAVDVIRKRAFTLEGLGKGVQGSFDNWMEEGNDVNLSLWDSSMTSMETTGGGKRFCEAITTRLLGKNERLGKVSLEYSQWLESISAIEATIRSLRETRWEDATDDVDDEEDVLDDRQILLSEDDPRLLQEELTGSLKEIYERMQKSLESAKVDSGLPRSGQKAVFLLRVWRDIRSRLPSSYRNSSLGLDSVCTLATKVVEAALEAPVKSCSQRLIKSAKKRSLTARSLWEGSPELPVLPSPWAYRLLLEIVQSMTQLGTDIWSPYLSRILRQGLVMELAKTLTQTSNTAELTLRHAASHSNGHVQRENEGEINGVLEAAQKEKSSEGTNAMQVMDDKGISKEISINGTHVNGESTPVEDVKRYEQVAKDKQTQRLFDVLFLSNACSVASNSYEDKAEKPNLSSISASLEGDLELDTKTLERLRKDAGEYWKRTKLLFALLQ